jgi:hypothetical protein
MKRPREAPPPNGWDRLAWNRWRRGPYEIRAVKVNSALHYHAVYAPGRTWLGMRDQWVRTAREARAWCEDDQRQGRSNGGAGQ